MWYSLISQNTPVYTLLVIQGARSSGLHSFVHFWDIPDLALPVTFPDSTLSLEVLNP